jgi:2-iminobutanoate/2-iminopropanoate deaminase
MSKVQLINSNALIAPSGHYSHAVCSNGFVFVSGLLPITADGRKMTGEPFEAQVEQVMNNMSEVLNGCGSAVSSLVQVRVYLRHVTNWSVFNRLYADWLGDLRPARCVVPVPDLHFGLELEMEAVAVLTEQRKNL